MTDVSECMKGPVLLVKDNADILRPLESILEKSGILTVTYTDPARAMEEISEGLHYKLAVVDLSYERSQLYGIHVFNESKRVNPKVPVIIMTGYGNKSLALAWALNGIITKPLDTREFAAFISRRLEIVAQR